MAKSNPFDPILSVELQPYQGDMPSDGKFRDVSFDAPTLRFEFCDEFNGCTFKKVRFQGDYKKTTFVDCVFEQCDLSNLVFSQSQFFRVRFDRCKGTGSIVRQSKFKFVQFSQCLFSLADFSESNFEQVRFLDSSFSESAFQSLKQSAWVTHKVDFSEADLIDTPLTGMDLSGCVLHGVRLSPQKLKGLTVDTEQAVGLVALLGVKVKERQD